MITEKEAPRYVLIGLNISISDFYSHSYYGTSVGKEKRPTLSSTYAPSSDQEFRKGEDQ
jgi:hypothetical protein